jgi:hypothetical protein
LDDLDGTFLKETSVLNGEATAAVIPVTSGRWTRVALRVGNVARDGGMGSLRLISALGFADAVLADDLAFLFILVFAAGAETVRVGFKAAGGDANEGAETGSGYADRVRS